MFLSTASSAVVPGVPDIPEISHLDQAPPENAVPRRPSLLQVPTTPLEDLQGESRTWRILERVECGKPNRKLPVPNYHLVMGFINLYNIPLICGNIGNGLTLGSPH